MSVTAVRKDPHTLTMVVEAEFDASPERVWQLWADPRQLERWWGPPSYPATFTRHELSPGGRVEYYMTGAKGDLPTFTGRVRIEEVEPGRTRMSIESVFPSATVMERALAVGMEEGMRLAVGQIDAILAANPVAQR